MKNGDQKIMWKVPTVGILLQAKELHTWRVWETASSIGTTLLVFFWHVTV